MSPLTVGVKLLVASVGVLVFSVIAVAGVGIAGTARMNLEVARLYDDNLVTVQHIADLQTALHDLNDSATELNLGVDAERASQLDVALDQVLIPRVRQSIVSLRELALRGLDRQASQFGEDLDEMEVHLDEYLELRPAIVLSTIEENVDAAAASQVPLARVEGVFHQMSALVADMQADESQEALERRSEAIESYESTRRHMAVSVGLALLSGLGITLLIIRNVVPRIRDYSRFAADVASGGSPGMLEPRGNDELSQLGRALNDLVVNRELLSVREACQVEYVDTLQVTGSEGEAHDLVQRHIERSIPESAVVVLQRNNSANRLEAATELAPESDLARRIVGAEPRSCLALRFGRPHREGTARPPLLSCDLCSNHNVASTCEPLLVGGEVIGSVLVSHQQLLDGHEDGLIKNSVAQAAPVLANLRNLALAEFRANNDSLTGLPNKRAAEETMKRMIAQANRSVSPLAAVVLDLDHFKQINDRFGHGKGDEVLAAVGAALTSCLRESDFAGRFGGEEFLILLPETTITGAVQVAEKIRVSVASIKVTGVERDITASLGIAGLIETAGGATGLLREADRALYAAKAAGRNRTVVATSSDLEGRSQVDVGDSVTI
jgi:diguanylate cyclase (GGDEF)-like protein